MIQVLATVGSCCLTFTLENTTEVNTETFSMNFGTEYTFCHFSSPVIAMSMNVVNYFAFCSLHGFMYLWTEKQTEEQRNDLQLA